MLRSAECIPSNRCKTGKSQTSCKVHRSRGSLLIMPLMVTNNSRLGPREGGKSICKEASELSDEMDVPDGDKGIDVSAAGVDSVCCPPEVKCSSRSEKSSERSFCQAIPSFAKTTQACEFWPGHDDGTPYLLEGSVTFRLASSRVIPKLCREIDQSPRICVTVHRRRSPVNVCGLSKLATQRFRTQVFSVSLSR